MPRVFTDKKTRPLADLRSHLGPTRIPISVLPLGLWTGTGNYAKCL